MQLLISSPALVRDNLHSAAIKLQMGIFAQGHHQATLKNNQ
jgi:hypothetical protein